MDHASNPDSGESCWENRASWANGRIRYCDHLHLVPIALWIGCILSLLSLVPLVIGLMMLNHGPGWTLLFVFAILALAGSQVLLGGIKLQAKWRRDGDSVFHMAGFPGVIGGCFAGVVQTGRIVKSPEGFRVGLCCREHNRDSEVKSATLLWDAERIIHGDLQLPEDGGTAIPVMFAIPFLLPESNTLTKMGQVNWTLSVRALSTPADYFSEFEVPVFKTSKSDRSNQPDETEIQKYELPVDFDQQFLDSGILQQSLVNGGLRFAFLRCRHKQLAAALASLQLVASFLVVLPFIFLGSVAWPLIAGLLGMLMIPTLADLYLLHSQIECTRRGLDVRSGKLILGSPRQIDVGDVKHFVALERGSTTNNFHETTRFYHLFVELNDGTRILFAKNVFPKSAAFEIVRRLEQCVGIDNPESKNYADSKKIEFVRDSLDRNVG